MVAGTARAELRDGVLAAGARRRPARPLFRGERRALLEAAAVDTGGGGIALDVPNRIGREALRGGCRWRRGSVERQADLWGKEGCSVGALDESGKIVRAQGHSPQTS